MVQVNKSPVNINAIFIFFIETRFPSQVNVRTIRFPSILEDTRLGFLGNAVVDITWEKPSGRK